MPEHNGDFSPEAERKRQLKREKVQRSRIRSRIAEGRATGEEIAAIDAWNDGYEWVCPAQGQAPRPVPISRSRELAQGDEEEEESTPMGWKGWAVMGGIGAAILGAAWWVVKNSG